MLRLTLKRTERLKSRKTIETLFAQGNHLAAYPLRFAWLLQKSKQVLIHSEIAIEPLEGNEITDIDIQKPDFFEVKRSIIAPPLQFGVSVPKRNFKRANVRNLLKRRMREAYRLQKNDIYTLLAQQQLSLSIMCIYSAKEVLPYQAIEPKMKILLDKMMKLINENALKMDNAAK